MKSSEIYIRKILNRGFETFLYIAILLTVAIAGFSWIVGFHTDALFATATIPIQLLAWYLTRRGTIYGILLIIIVSAIGSSWSASPASTYIGPAVSIYLIVAPLIATRFLEPHSGIWTLFIQLFFLVFALVVKDIPSAIIVRYSFYALLDLGIITTAFIISSSILRKAITTSYDDEIELQRMYDDILSGWSHALELRNKETRGHTDRVTQLTMTVAAAIGIPESDMPDIRRGALLHDIGKTGIPDSILLKPGPLSPIERDIMKLHPTYAYQWLRPFQRFGKALDIPYCHHERWDGSGYPRGLKGRDIPISARIFSIADVYDALCSARPYRAAMPREDARKYIEDRAGTDFDPALVTVFLREEESLFNHTDDIIT